MRLQTEQHTAHTSPSASQPDKYHCTIKMTPAVPSNDTTELHTEGAQTAICPAGWSLVWDSSWFTTAPSNKHYNHSKSFPDHYSLKMLKGSHDRKVGTMTRPWPRQFVVWIPGSSKNILHNGPPSLPFSAYWELLLQVQSTRGVKLTAHLHLGPTLTISAPPICPVAWSGAASCCCQP